MGDVVGGFQTHEEVRTRALVVAWRASRVGEPAPGAFLLRRTRNPLDALTGQEYDRYCAARLAAAASLRDAAAAEPDLFVTVHESGRCPGGVFDVVDLPPSTLDDLIARRLRPDPAALHRVLERLLDACAALHTRTGRAHGALGPESIFLESELLHWGAGVRIGEPPAAFAPPDGPAADLRAVGRIMHLIALHRPPDAGVFGDDGDATGFRRFGRNGVRHRRLCADLLTASPGRADFGFEQAVAALHAIRPHTPGTRRAIRVGGAGALAAVVAGAAAAGWVLTRPQVELGDPPPKRQFDESKAFAILVTNALGQAQNAPLQQRLATPEFEAAIGLLSVEALKQSGEFGDWFNAGRGRVESRTADHHRLIVWTVPNVERWQAAYDAALEAVRTRLVEPLQEVSSRAAEQGWSAAARDAQQAAERCAGLIERGELRALADTVDDAAALHARIEGHFSRLAEARARATQVADAVEQRGAMIAIEGGASRPAHEAVRQWLDALALAQPGEEPDATIARFASQSAAVLQDVADGADYWATNERFNSERFLAEGPKAAAGVFVDAGAGRDALLAWRASVEDSRFIDLGPDPRIRLAERRQQLAQQVGDFAGGLTTEELDIVRDRVGALERQLETIESPLAGVGEWSPENELTVLDAVAQAESRLAEASDALVGAQSFLEERANIELRRRGAIARAEALLGEFPGWFDSRLRPMVETARTAGNDALEQTLNALADETQRLRAASRDAEALQASVESLRGDTTNFGDALRGRAADLLEQWRDAIVGAPAGADEIRTRIGRLVELRDGATGALAVIDARDGAIAPEDAERVVTLAADLRDAGVDPGANLEQGRLFQAIEQLSPYLAARGQWPSLNQRLGVDMSAVSLRNEVVWHAYELLREAERDAEPALSAADIDLERAVRARLVAAGSALPDRLATPSIPERLDAWMADRPGQWSDRVDAGADLAAAETILAETGADAPPHIASARLLDAALVYAPADDAPDDEVRLRIGDFRTRIAELRPTVPGDGQWYALLSVVDQRLADLEAGRGGPRLDLELLATIGPAGAGWTLAPASTIERPVYERGGVSMPFALIEDFDPPFYLASDELTLGAFQQIIRAAPEPLWSLVSGHALVKDWGVTPDDEALPNEIRGYWATSQRAVELQTDWISPPAQVREGGVNWNAHRDLIYGDDAARSQAWSPTLETPLHLVGFQGAWATAAAAGCRLPTPEEWLAALDRADLRQGEAPNVSDAAWLRQAQRGGRGVPSPAARSFFAFGTREAPEPYQPQDDGWLWLRPIDFAPAGPTLRDMIGNVAEWADALAGARPEDFAPESLADEDLEASARIVGVSAMSGAGAPEQVVLLSRSRRDRRANLLADVVRGGGIGFPDVGVRLAFGVGDAAPKSLAGRYAQTMEDVLPLVAAEESPG